MAIDQARHMQTAQYCIDTRQGNPGLAGHVFHDHRPLGGAQGLPNGRSSVTRYLNIHGKKAPGASGPTWRQVPSLARVQAGKCIASFTRSPNLLISGILPACWDYRPASGSPLTRTPYWGYSWELTAAVPAPIQEASATRLGGGDTPGVCDRTVRPLATLRRIRKTGDAESPTFISERLVARPINPAGK